MKPARIRHLAWLALFAGCAGVAHGCTLDTEGTLVQFPPGPDQDSSAGSGGAAGSGAMGGGGEGVDSAAGTGGSAGAGGTSGDGGTAVTPDGSAGSAGTGGSSGTGGQDAQAGAAGTSQDAPAETVECGCPVCTGFDEDQDGIDNSCDNCPQMPNQDQLNEDNDAIGTACEAYSASVLTKRVGFDGFDPQPLLGWTLNSFQATNGALLIDKADNPAMFFALAPFSKTSAYRGLDAVIEIQSEPGDPQLLTGVGIGLRAVDVGGGSYDFVGCWVSLASGVLTPSYPGSTCIEGEPCYMWLLTYPVALPSMPAVFGLRIRAFDDQGTTQIRCQMYEPTDPTALPTGTQWITTPTGFGSDTDEAPGTAILWGAGVKAYFRSVDLLEE